MSPVTSAITLGAAVAVPALALVIAMNWGDIRYWLGGWRYKGQRRKPRKPGTDVEPLRVPFGDMLPPRPEPDYRDEDPEFWPDAVLPAVPVGDGDEFVALRRDRPRVNPWAPPAFQDLPRPGERGSRHSHEAEGTVRRSGPGQPGGCACIIGNGHTLATATVNDCRAHGTLPFDPQEAPTIKFILPRVAAGRHARAGQYSDVQRRELGMLRERIAAGGAW